MQWMLYFSLFPSEFLSALVRIGIIAITGPLPFLPLQSCWPHLWMNSKDVGIKDKDEIIIIADAEHNESFCIIMSGRRHAWKEWKLLAVLISCDHCTSPFTVNKTKLNLLKMQKNAAVGDGVFCFDQSFLSFQLKFWTWLFKNDSLIILW